METGSITKSPAGAQAPVAAPRPDALAGAVPTELPATATVRQVTPAEPVRFEKSGGVDTRAALDAALRAVIDRNTEIDPKTREVVYQTVDRDSGEVIRQTPDEALLRLRAYAREMRAAAFAPSSAQDEARVEKLA